MKTENAYQLELFSHSRSHNYLKKRSGKPFFTYIRGYEKVILIVIGFFATGLFSFSLGVEKGKKLALARDNFMPPVKQEMVIEDKTVNNLIPNVPKPEKQPVITSEEIVKQLPAPQKTGSAYTVQLASYKTRVSAQKEAQALKKKGFSTLILSKGSYVVLCVGNFSTKETARQLVLQLQKRYRDCYIRRL